MEVTTYCEKLVAELDVWKEKADRIAKELDNTTLPEKEKILPEILELHMLVEELCERIDQVKTRCLDAWEPDEIGVIEVRTHKIGDRGKEWEYLSWA